MKVSLRNKSNWGFLTYFCETVHRLINKCLMTNAEPLVFRLFQKVKKLQIAKKQIRLSSFIINKTVNKRKELS